MNQPPLTAEAQEQILSAEYETHRAFSGTLAVFSAVSLPAPPGLLLIAPVPDPPRQPIRLLNLLKRYAVDLFDCEERLYPQTEELPSWRDALATRIESLVLEKVVSFEKGSRSLRFHAGRDEMMTSVREGLAGHINSLNGTIRRTREALADYRSELEGKAPGSGKLRERAQIISENKADKPQFPDRASWLNDRLRERSWNKHDLSRQGGPEQKTVQKILDGRRVREDVLEKLANALSKAPVAKKLPAVKLLDIPQR